MSVFKVKVKGDAIDLQKYLRSTGLTIKESRKRSKNGVIDLEFDNLTEFKKSVIHFDDLGFLVETDCEFSENVPIGTMLSREVDKIEDFSNKKHLANLDIINAISFWQTDETVKKIICPNNKEHGILHPGLESDTDKVVLGCTKCDYLTYDIPEEIILYYNENKNKKDE